MFHVCAPSHVTSQTATERGPEEAGLLGPNQLCFRSPAQPDANGADGNVPSSCPPGLPLAVADLPMI